MIIVGNPSDYKKVARKCDGRCADGEWCVFADVTDCPIDNHYNFIVVVENKDHTGLVVE